MNSHIIPKHYLERFAMPSIFGERKPGRIWVYEKGREPDERATSVQGRENGYFAFTMPGGTVEESFEFTLAQKENECNGVVSFARSEIYRWPIGSEEKLAFYAALLFRRATQQRSFSERNWTGIIKEMREAANDREYIAQMARDLGSRHGIAISEDSLRQSISRWADEAMTPAEIRNAFLHDLLELTDLGAQQLMKKRPWRVLRPAAGMEFVTSDNPLVTFVPLREDLLHPGYGFNRADADAAFPLAPDACLLVGGAWKVPSQLDTVATGALNDAAISVSDRYVYSRSLCRRVQDRVNEVGGVVRYGVNAFVLLGTRAPSPREFLRSRLGLD